MHCSLSDPVNQFKALQQALSVKSKKLSHSVIIKTSPTETNYGSVILVTHDNNIYLTVLDKKYFRVNSLAEGLAVIMKLHYVFDIEYPKIANRIYIFLEHLCGIPGVSKLSGSMESLLSI